MSGVPNWAPCRDPVNMSLRPVNLSPTCPLASTGVPSPEHAFTSGTALVDLAKRISPHSRTSGSVPHRAPRSSAGGSGRRPSRGWRVRKGASDPSKGATTVELVVATPLMLLLLMLVVQFAVWAHAEHVAQAAANTGVQAARAYKATPEQGRADAATVLAKSAGTVLTGVQVSAGRDATTATVTVTGQALPVVPGLHLPVRASVTAPRELVPGNP
jgi:hypothetical protein